MILDRLPVTYTATIAPRGHRSVLSIPSREYRRPPVCPKPEERRP